MLNQLRKRRSVRTYTQQPIDEKAIAVLKEACVRSPSSRNLNPWQFLFISDAALLEKLSQAKPHGASFLKHAPLGIVICADDKKCDVWIEDCAIAAILIQMTAVELGLGSCWIQIRKRQHNETLSSEAYIRQVLSLPDDLRIASIIALGHPAEQPPPLDYESLPHHAVKEIV